jgi:hypothetical protein
VVEPVRGSRWVPVAPPGAVAERPPCHRGPWCRRRLRRRPTRVFWAIRWDDNFLSKGPFDMPSTYDPDA